MLRHPLRDWFAPSADYFARRKLAVIQAFFARQTVATRDLRWLDVGCGQGDLVCLGRGEFGEIAGCDPSPEMLLACGDLPVRVQAAADEIPYPRGTFDLATLVCVLHHVAPPARLGLVRGIAGALRPGGWLCVVEHNPWNAVTQYLVRRSPIDRGALLLSARATAGLLRKSGFEPVERRYFLFVPERLHALLGHWEHRLGSLPLGGQYALFARRADHANPPGELVADAEPPAAEDWRAAARRKS